jgi:hypothetical protein
MAKGCGSAAIGLRPAVQVSKRAQACLLVRLRAPELSMAAHPSNAEAEIIKPRRCYCFVRRMIAFCSDTLGEALCHLPILAFSPAPAEPT